MTETALPDADTRYRFDAIGGAGEGLLITPEETAALVDLLDLDVPALLDDAGYVLFRGFTGDLDAFNAVVRGHSGKLSLDPARQFEGNVAQLVDSGTDEIGLHLENGATPFLPDLLWFYSVRAASTGSETTVCDGVRVWEKLSEPTRDILQNNPLRFSRQVPGAAWRAFAAFIIGDVRPEDLTLGDLERLADSHGSVTVEDTGDDGIRYTFDSPAVRHPRGKQDVFAWANSIFGPSFNYESPVIRFANGEEIPQWVVDECKAVSDSVTENIAWHDGDLVLIDNTRVMHGRRAILDTDRRIVNAQSYVK